MSAKKKILLLSDHPLSVSGVGTQARWLINGLLETKRYTFRCFGAALKHQDKQTVVVNEDFIIRPTEGFGDPNMIRQVLVMEQPDALMLFTDPRFFIWVWEIEDEIHQVCPIVYNHLWDNSPWPEYNRVLYESTDLLNCINWPTYEMVKERFPEKTNYIPHAVPPELYFPMKKEDVQTVKRRLIGPERADHFIALYVGRNARRKMVNDICVSWKMFLDELEKKHGHRKATLLLHTDPFDPEGANLHHVLECFNLKNDVVFSKDRIAFEDMNSLYNITDVQLNRSCFAAGTQVVTKEGYKAIEDVRVGDLALTHKRRWRPVVQTIVNPPPGNALKMSIVGMDDIVVTPNHKLFAIRKSDLPKGYLINENLEDFVSRAVGVSVGELQRGDYVVHHGLQRQLPKQVQYDMYHYADGLKHFVHVDGDRLVSTCNMRNKHDHGCRYVKLDDDLAYVLGEFVGNGCTNSSSVAFNKKDVYLIETYARKLAKCFGVKALISERTKHIDVTPQNEPIIRNFFRSMCGQYSHGKQIPEDIMNASDEVKKAFLAGYVAADGCYIKDRRKRTTPTWRCRTVSNKLVMQLRELLISIGIVPRVHLTDNSHGYNKNGKIWTIEWNDIVERGQMFNGSCRSWTHNKISVSRITSLEKIDHHEPVYNLTVEEDHTYVVENITVFNCNEGFGLPTLEGAMAGTPMISIVTGGLGRQVRDHITGEEYGVALDPEVRALVGNQMIPYIYEDYVSHETYANAIMKMYEMGPEAREEIGKKAIEHVKRDYVLTDLVEKWDKTLTECIESWSDKHERWNYTEI